MLEQKVYSHPENLGQLNYLNLHFVLIIPVLVDIYSSLFFFKETDFNSGNNFALPWVDKVTTGT